MFVGTLLASGFIQLVTAGSFAYVATVVRAKSASAIDRPAVAAFTAWWGCLAAYLVVTGTLAIAAAFGSTDPGLWLVGRFFTTPLITIAVWGLTYYVAYLYTGSGRLALPLAGFYALVGVGLAIAGFVPMPQSVTVGPWTAELSGAGESVLFRVVYIFIGLPPIVASVAYGSLYFRLSDPLQRYRVALVSLSIVAWIGSGLAAYLSSSDTLHFATLVLFGLGASVTVVLAYRPPRAWLKRLGAAEEVARVEREAAQRHAVRSARLRRRAQELV
ncbi:MAG: hypothetical protein ACYDCK_05065 [Thermoplasmatota archaeon]